jgi:hypothetical protein
MAKLLLQFEGQVLKETPALSRDLGIVKIVTNSALRRLARLRWPSVKIRAEV